MTSSVLRVQHTSMQFNDNPAQQEHDVLTLFKTGKQFPVKTGTESGSDAGGKNHNAEFLRKFAKEYNHVLQVLPTGNWVAVDRAIIKPGTSKKGSIFVAKNDFIVGKMHDRLAATLAFTHVDPRIGRIGMAAAHYPTKGARPSDPNYKWNKLYADRIAEWMKVAGRGASLAFANGDFNMNDRDLDVALGQNFTTMADELKNHQNTGHGPIDALCSYDRDGRVSAKSFVVLDDTELKMYTDHYVLRGVWTVRHLKVK